MSSQRVLPTEGNLNRRLKQINVASRCNRRDASGLWPDKVVTEVIPASDFWEAEPEHQDYLQRYPGGYTCHFIRPNWRLPIRAQPEIVIEQLTALPRTYTRESLSAAAAFNSRKEHESLSQARFIKSVKACTDGSSV